MEMKTSAFNDSSHFTFNGSIAKTVDTGIDMHDESCEWSEELWIFKKSHEGSSLEFVNVYSVN